jgi:hypothetical protein
MIPSGQRKLVYGEFAGKSVNVVYAYHVGTTVTNCTVQYKLKCCFVHVHAILGRVTLIIISLKMQL